MQRFIKGETYRIDEHPHFYQGNENGIYRFLKWDGSIKYIKETDLEKVKPGKSAEQLSEAKEKADYYMEKYLWYKKKEESKALQEQYIQKKNSEWFAANRYVQIAGLLTMIASTIAGVILVSRIPNFGAGVATFIVLMVLGVIVSLIVSWLTYKLFDS